MTTIDILLMAVTFLALIIVAAMSVENLTKPYLKEETGKTRNYIQ